MSSDDQNAPLPLDAPQRFLRGVWALNHAIERCSRAMSTRIGVTFQQRTVLRLVGRFPGITAGKLAETLHVDRGTLSTTLARLEDRALLERRQDPKDRRRVRLGLTSNGRALDVPTPGTVEQAVERALAMMSPEDAQAAERAVSMLVRELERQIA